MSTIYTLNDILKKKKLQGSGKLYDFVMKCNENLKEIDENENFDHFIKDFDAITVNSNKVIIDFIAEKIPFLFHSRRREGLARAIVNSLPEDQPRFIKFANEYIQSEKRRITGDERKLKAIRERLEALPKTQRFCYEVNGQICISRKVLEALIRPGKLKTLLNEQKIEKSIKHLTGSDDESVFREFYNLKSATKKLSTKIRQEFICIAINYVFSNNKSTIYDFLFDMEMGNVSVPSNVKISNEMKAFEEFSYNQNFMYLSDSFATAKTLFANKSKLKLNKDISSYKIAEESSAKHLKENPFQRIKNTESNYYDKSDKLTPADIFIYDTTDNKYKNMMLIFNKKDKKLTHNQYRHFMNRCLMVGSAIPISLKQLVTDSIDSTNNNFITNRFKIVGSYNLKNPETGGRYTTIEDEYMKAVMELFNTQNRTTFIKKIDEMIDIKFDEVDLGIHKKQINIHFKTQFRKGILKEYKLWFTSGQIHIMPHKSTSNSGLGGISRDYLFKNVISRLPRKPSFIGKLVSAREDSIGGAFNAKGITNSNIKSPKILTEGNFKSIINDLKKQKISDNDIKDILFSYVKELSDDILKKTSNFNFDGKEDTFRKISNKIDHYAQKMSMLEMAAYVVSHEQIVYDWIKDSFIMSLWAAASSTGLILFNGNHVNLKGLSARQRIKKMGNRLNPLYVKIGF